MESRDENGYNEQGTSIKFLGHTIEIRRAPEKLYCLRENDTGKNRNVNGNKVRLSGTST